MQNLMGSAPRLRAVAAALAKGTSAIVTLAGRARGSCLFDTYVCAGQSVSIAAP